MTTWRRRAALALGGTTALLAPLGLQQTAAGAAIKNGQTSGQITFVDLYTDQSDTCTVTLRITHDTSAHTANAFSSSSGSGYACTHDVLFTVTITSDDQAGRTHRGTAQSYNGTTEIVDQAFSHVSATVQAYFNDSDTPTAKEVDLSVSPK